MAKKTKKENKEVPQSEAVAPQENSGVPGLSIQLDMARLQQHGSDRLIVTVRLLQDGVVISSDQDYIRL